MRILWFCNMPLPEASSLMNEEPLPYGGWMTSLVSVLRENDDIDLHIAFPFYKTVISGFDVFQGDNVRYYPFKITKKCRNNFLFSKTKSPIKDIIHCVEPDIIHIFGTEASYIGEIMDNFNAYRIILHLQGITSIIEHHYTLLLPDAIKRKKTLRDFLRNDSIVKQQKAFRKQGVLERELLQRLHFVIGRTVFDHACVFQINPYIQYFKNNESLRESFYHTRWDIRQCKPKTIFMSQGYYPIKGLHSMLEALRIIKVFYPEVCLQVAGINVIRQDTILDGMRLSSYGFYIRSLITKYDLSNNIVFTGELNEQAMSERMSKAHVFVCPSSIENSPNSLGEAMMLGVPCVASFVGGIPDLLTHNSEGFLYPADAPYMLANYIMEIFKDDELAIRFSNNSQKRAKETHDKIKNAQNLLNIYKYMLEAKNP